MILLWADMMRATKKADVFTVLHRKMQNIQCHHLITQLLMVP